MSGPWMAFLGSGEFDPWSEAVDRWAIERSRNPSGPVLVAPTAAAHEGDESFDGWGNKGLEHYAALGVPAEVLPLKTREDAHRDDLVRRLDDASIVFFSGGNPARLADVLRATPFWEELVRAQGDGLPYAGCSAGVACLAEVTFNSESQGLDAIWASGLGYVRGVRFAPHWDIVDTWIPEATTFIVEAVGPSDTFVGLDEETAMVGDGRIWEVIGRAKMHVLRDGEWTRYASGDTFELPMELAGA